MLRGFKRNEQMINFDYIPKEIEKNIMDEYDLQANKDRSQLFNYFVTNKLKGLTDAINDF